jgi:acetyltransferase-like isoleucine patch superfamily enzyme
MKYLIRTLFVSFFLLADAQAIWETPAKQVSVRTNNFSNLGQVSNTSNAPVGSLQAVLEWMDDYWDISDFDTNNSYYYVGGTTQNFWRVIVRDYLRVDNGATVATNFYVGDSAWVSNDLYIGDDLFVGDDATVGDSLVVSNDITAGDDLFAGDDATIGGDLVVTGAVTAGSLSTTGALSVGSLLSTNNDMAVSFMGYPKITLTNTMMTLYYTGATPIQTNNWNSLFDLSMATAATGTITEGVYQRYVIDLGGNYQGFVSVKQKLAGAGALTISGSATYEPTGYHGASGGVNNYLIQTAANDGTNTFVNINFGVGRYLTLQAFGGSGANVTYEWYDFSVYGVTNGYRNMGGF